MTTQTFNPTSPISGHLSLYEGKRRTTWYAKWRDLRGQHERALGPAWTGKGPPPPGFLRRREAQAKLDELLVDARQGLLRQQRTGFTFADVAEEWYERGRFEQDWSASTRRDYRSILDAHLLPAFGSKRIEAITTNEIERWRDQLATRPVPSSSDSGRRKESKPRSRRTINKIVGQLYSVLEYATRHARLATNAAAPIERLRESNNTKRFDFYSPEEIDKLVATAASGGHRHPHRPAVSETERALRHEEDRQDAAIYLTAALSGLRRSELLALLWDDIDFKQSSIRVFEGYRDKQKGQTKSRRSRTVPMVDKVAGALKELKQRGRHTANSDNVFVSRKGTPLDGSALRRRYLATLEAAGLRPLRFHDLRHTFGSLAINVASIIQVQAWLGHADVKTTMRYLHHKSRADDAQLLSTAFHT